ncbi:MAG TPA: rhodanese-like domain-containing protein [Pyrinomonadaceae bacterium]|nr:rhodanese-like domain-containing protein [Pyrinomonadaceae bacterium]
MTKVEVSEVQRRLAAGEDITLVDARSDHAWNESDIEAGGAVRIPPDEAEQHVADVKRDSFVVTYCT